MQKRIPHPSPHCRVAMPCNEFCARRSPSWRIAAPRRQRRATTRAWYAVSTEDRTINPDLQRFMAKRMGAKTVEVKASHLSLMPQPDTIAALILEAAAGQK